MCYLRNPPEDKRASLMKDICETEIEWPKIKSYKTLK